MVRLAALWTLAMVLAACGPPRVELKTAEDCDGGKIADCRAKCDQNEGRACYRLGWFHEEGRHVDENYKRAVTLYTKACDANWAVACRALGEIYWRGNDDQKRNRKKGIEYFAKACSLGLENVCPTQNELDLAEGTKKAATEKPGGSIGIGVSVEAGAAPEPSPPVPTP